MSARPSGRYAKYACSMCDYAGYTQQLLDAHMKLRGHGAAGRGGGRGGTRGGVARGGASGGNPAALLGERPGSSGLLGAYGSSPGPAPGGRLQRGMAGGLPDVASPSLLQPPFNQQPHRPPPPPGPPAPLLATPGNPPVTLTQDVVETTLAKFNLPPNAVPFKGLSSEEFLQRLEEELLKRANPGDAIRQKIDAILHSSAGRLNQDGQKQLARGQPPQQQQSESPPPISDTEELLAMALRHNDFKTARELTDLLEKEKELQARKAALAKLIPKTPMPGGAPLKLGEEVNMAESFKQYWATKRTAGDRGETSSSSSSVTEAVPNKRTARWTRDDQWPAGGPLPTPPASPREFSYRKIDLNPDTILPSAFLTFMEGDPTLFWIRQLDNETTFQLINQELTRLAQTGTLRSVERPVREGMGCIAIVNMENLWHHRVEVVEQMNTGDIRVRLVDDGRMVVISNPDNLKYVPDADGIVARSPALGIPCSLVGFQPNEQWRTAGEKCFNLFKLAVGDAKSLKFVQKSANGVYGVEVFSDKGQSLAVYLVQKGMGFATPSGGFNGNGNNAPPPGAPRPIRPPGGPGFGGPGFGPAGPATAPAFDGPRPPAPGFGGPPAPHPIGGGGGGFGPRGPSPFPPLNDLPHAPRAVPPGFPGPMEPPRHPPIGAGRPGHMMPPRPLFFDRR